MSFKEFLKIKEGLQTQLGKRAPESLSGAAGKYATDMATELVPGAGAIKTTGEFLWNIISNQRQRVNFSEMNNKATMHKQALAKAGIDPAQVFQLDDNLARLLSDEMVYAVMQDALARLDRIAQNGYRGLPKGNNLVELVVLNKLRPFMQSLAGQAPRAIPA